MAHFTFFVAGEARKMFCIRDHISLYGVTPLFDSHGLALKDSLPGAVRSASRYTRVTHAVVLSVGPMMMLDMFMQGFATRSFRNFSTGVDLHKCPVHRYQLEVNVIALSTNDLLFSSLRTPSPDRAPHTTSSPSPGPNDSR
jgi:hypothetical protein